VSAPESYFALSAELPESSSELAQWLFHKNDSLGLEIRDESVRAMPGEPLLKGGRVRLVAFFGERQQAERAREELRRRVPDVRLSLSEALCEDWSESWKSQVRSAQVGRIWVGPPWRTADAAPGSLRILIEPKMAFGTGDHPTTQLCLQALDELLTGGPARGFWRSPPRSWERNGYSRWTPIPKRSPLPRRIASSIRWTASGCPTRRSLRLMNRSTSWSPTFSPMPWYSLRPTSVAWREST